MESSRSLKQKYKIENPQKTGREKPSSKCAQKKNRGKLKTSSEASSWSQQDESSPANGTERERLRR